MRIGKLEIGLVSLDGRMRIVAGVVAKSWDGQDLRKCVVTLDSWETVFWYENLFSKKIT